jgi:phage tail-like protein
MSKKKERNLKYVGFGVLIFVLIMGFTFANYTSAKAQGQILRRAPTPVPQVQVGTHYGLELQGVVTGFFSEAYNIGSEHEIIEQKTLKQNQYVVIKIPGKLKFSDITLKRGITNNMDLWKWRKMVEDGAVNSARRDGSLVMYDSTLKEIARWNFLRAWPSKLIGNPVDALATSPSGSMTIESVTIAVEWIERRK